MNFWIAVMMLIFGGAIIGFIIGRGSLIEKINQQEKTITSLRHKLTIANVAKIYAEYDAEVERAREALKIEPEIEKDVAEELCDD